MIFVLSLWFVHVQHDSDIAIRIGRAVVNDALSSLYAFQEPTTLGHSLYEATVLAGGLTRATDGNS